MANNPYQPPPVIEESGSAENVLAQFLRWLLSTPTSYRFGNGGPLLYNGIQFRIPTKDRQTLYADSPSAKESDERMQLVVQVVLETTPKLVRDYPSLRRRLAGCQLVVRLIDHYNAPIHDFKRQLETNKLVADILSETLDNLQQDETITNV